MQGPNKPKTEEPNSLSNDFIPPDQFSGEMEDVNCLKHWLYRFLPKIN
jgi:hypothetical protein